MYHYTTPVINKSIMNMPFLDIEQRSGVKNEEIDDFLSKVNAVDEAIRGLKVSKRPALALPLPGDNLFDHRSLSQDGKIDPTTEIKIPGIMTESEKRQAEVMHKLTLPLYTLDTCSSYLLCI